MRTLVGSHAVVADSDRKLDDSFVELMTKNQLRLRSFILTLVRDAPAADDVFQETSLVIWKKRQDFDFSKDFFRWGCGVALLEVLQYRRKADADRLLFDEELINVLAVDYIEHVEDWDMQRTALRGCMQKLAVRRPLVVGCPLPVGREDGSDCRTTGPPA